MDVSRVKDQKNVSEILPLCTYDNDETNCRPRLVVNKYKKCEYSNANEVFSTENETTGLDKTTEGLLKGLIPHSNDHVKNRDPIDKLYSLFNTLNDNQFPKQYIPARYNISKGITDELFHKTEIEVNFETVKMSLWKACTIMEQVNGVKS
ncbi:uncharacterized protein LOC106669941 [Cimex lectularius]|uniref:Uncharacterized protein n=1 Tax=Cimex lectularius TaxID=79782 RepID=A0A8I6TGD9_CIMLE|nr:uncharacterized protein LOC106669941 [Cimex lectularius]XP_014255332.1 uncharacterized protein LOC106669941 [Cimex lectularius]